MLKYSCIVLLFFFVSCDKAANYNYCINNETSYDIRLVTKKTGYQGAIISKDSTIIVTGTNKNIKTDYSPDSGANNYAIVICDTMYILQNDTLLITKDIHKRENWEIKTHKTGFMVKTNNYDYTFRITNDDLKKR